MRRGLRLIPNPISIPLSLAGVTESAVAESGRFLVHVDPRLDSHFRTICPTGMILVVDSAKTGLPGEDYYGSGSYL